jgi:hypothetical protein
LSDITPFEVEMIAIPKPFNTLGIVAVPEYDLKPGLLILWSFLIAEVLVIGWYFKAILMLLSIPASSNL